MIASISRWTILRSHETLSSAILSTLLPTFGDIDDKVTRFVKEIERVDFQSDEISFQAGEYRAEQTSVYEDDLRSVEAEIAGLAIAGVYHSWERWIKRLLLATADIEEREIRRADFRRVLHLMNYEMFPNALRRCVCRINRARLITNIVKHGDGSSANELRRLDPRIFQRPWQDEHFELPSANGVALVWPDACRVRNTINAVREFWKRLPDTHFPPPHSPSLASLMAE